MSIVERVKDSLLLWESDRLEGAFLNALIAVAATSRIRYPDRKTTRDREAFELFLKDSMSNVRLSIEFRGTIHTVEHILYKWLRCELVHEGSIPIDIEFTEDNDLSVRAGGAPEYILRLSRGWFHHLINAVMNAPENSAYYSTVSEESS